MNYFRTLLLSAFPLFTLLVSISSTPGCLSTQTTSPVAETLDSVGLSFQTVRQANLRLAYRDGLTVEEAADRIAMLATDQATKINAQLWKIYTIPALRQVYSHTDPYGAIIDAVAFWRQCRDYLSTGIGRDRFGVYQQLAIDAVTTNEQHLIEASRRIATEAEIDSLLLKIELWAAEHPLENHVFERPSVLVDLEGAFGTKDYSIGSAVGRIADDVDDLSGRLSLLAAQLPREARWQGEYLITDLELDRRLGNLDTTIALLTTSLAQLRGDLRSGRIVVDVASLQSLHSDLENALALASSERAIVMQEIDRIRLETLSAAEEAGKRTIEQSLVHVEEIVDRILLKIGGFFVLAAVGLAVLVWAIRRSAARGGKGHDR